MCLTRYESHQSHDGETDLLNKRKKTQFGEGALLVSSDST